MTDIYDIRADYEAYMAKRVGEKTLQNNLRASSLGFACDRHHYYCLTEYRDPPSWQLKAIFDLGNLYEGYVEKTLREMGYEVEGTQKNFRLEDPLVSIRIDGMLRKPGGQWVAYDAKTINDYDFKALSSAEDFIHSRKAHQRSYCVQIMAYMLATNAEYGCLILVSKQNGQLKPIWFSFNEHVGYLDEAMKRGKRVYEAVAKKEPPSRCDDIDLCLSCDWRSKCLPDLKQSPGVKLIESYEISPKLERLDELREAHKEFEDLDGELKDAFKTSGDGEYVAGAWMIRVKTTTFEVKAKEAGTGTRTTTKFVRMT